MVSEDAISILLGYSSIACWLGAQLPQIVVNWRRKSVDGLALPFLANWFLGDATNLAGCLLTNQLPFQTYLATYFVFVDLCLLTQYLHYDAARHVKSLSTLASPSARQSRTSLLLPRPVSYSPQAYTLPRSALPRSRSRAYSLDLHIPATAADVIVTSGLDERLHDPLAPEAGGSQRRWRSRESRRANSLEGLPESVVADPHDHHWGGRAVTSPEHEPSDEANDAESESSRSIMVGSFTSESGRGRGRGKRVSWSQESPTQDRNGRRLSQDVWPHDSWPSNTEPSGAGPSTVRGRQLTRLTIDDPPLVAEAPPGPSDTPPRSRRASTASSLSAAASRRGASIVFLSVFALFGLSSRADYRMRGDVRGEVLSASPNSDAFVPRAVAAPVEFSPPSVALTFASPDALALQSDDHPRISSSDGSARWFIGRISAWACTTLYLTSRLPQIWKNFARKSVEGLSMYLFVFAFLGNFFYVMSILTSPKMALPAPQARRFLRDSVPYLLGSGGTLLFDVTIVLQSFVYASAGREHSLRVIAKRKSLQAVGTGGEEEQGLLVEDNNDDVN